MAQLPRTIDAQRCQHAHATSRHRRAWRIHLDRCSAHIGVGCARDVPGRHGNPLGGQLSHGGSESILRVSRLLQALLQKSFDSFLGRRTLD
jgi:hypothetical protein